MAKVQGRAIPPADPTWDILQLVTASEARPPLAYFTRAAQKRAVVFCDQLQSRDREGTVFGASSARRDKLKACPTGSRPTNPPHTLI
jgi:hypothetical protein